MHLNIVVHTHYWDHHCFSADWAFKKKSVWPLQLPRWGCVWLRVLFHKSLLLAVMLLNLSRALNEHCLPPTNGWADRKAEPDSEVVSVDILPSSARWLSWAFITGRVCHLQHFQCFGKGVAILLSTQISPKVWLSLWGGGAAHRFCGSTAGQWKGKGPESALRRHGSGMEMCVWGSNHNVQSQASAYNL